MFRKILLVCISSFICLYSKSQQLEHDFANPQANARPIMIWQWMDGIVTKEGITADLEAYKKAGIGGVQNFQIGGKLQCIVKDTTNAIGSEKWKQLMRFAINECRRLGLSYGTHNCPGWTSSAYPSVTPEHSMQKIVWSKTTVKGKQRTVSTVIPKPDSKPFPDSYRDIAIIAMPDKDSVSLESVMVLPCLPDSKGRIKWSIPAGNWRLYRFGHASNGKTNNGTSPESGIGLECDKMSREAVRRFWMSYPTLLLELAGDNTGSVFTRLEIDSYEAGGQEWTPLMPIEFKKRNGYDIIPWLPIKDGVTIGDNNDIKKINDDWKNTVSDLFAENYYGYMSELAHQNGLKLLVQPYSTGKAEPFNPINTDKIVRRLHPDDPISAEFWAKPENWGWRDVPRVVKAANSVGRQQVYAEGFTCWPLYAWKSDPDELKRIADRAFCMGINALMLHAAAHNPWPDAKPGMTFGMWGTWWTPGQTWWENGASALFTYIARCQTLLQYGKFADNYQSAGQTMACDCEGIEWLHRNSNDADIYFITNATDSAKQVVATINMEGMQPEIWNPDNGEINDAMAWESGCGATKIGLTLDECQSMFIVFKRHADGNGPGLRKTSSIAVEKTNLDTKWSIGFPNGKTIVSDTLFQWNSHADNDIRYFSGTARYKTTFTMKEIESDSRYVIDLGEVRNMAIVNVNGQKCANLWKKPFRADITNALRKGENVVEIDVTNLWVNRLIGDEQEIDDMEWSDDFIFEHAPGKPAVGKFLKTIPKWLTDRQERPARNRKAIITFKFYDKDSELVPSGLLGPVKVIRVR